MKTCCDPRTSDDAAVFHKAWRNFFLRLSRRFRWLLRVLYGGCVSVTLILLHSDWLDWYGVHSWVSLATMKTMEPGVRLNLFTLLPQSDRWIGGFFWVF